MTECVILSSWEERTRVDALDHLIKFPGMDNHVLLSILNLIEALEFLQASDNDSCEGYPAEKVE